MRSDENSIRFEFDSYIFYPETGELKHKGARIRINRQTAELLGLLLAQAGALVTRDQIRDTLWPEREILDHDKVINNGISRLRYIFKDDPRHPTFIERIPKRGYRLMVSVAEIVQETTPPFRKNFPSLQIEAPANQSQNSEAQDFPNVELETGPASLMLNPEGPTTFAAPLPFAAERTGAASLRDRSKYPWLALVLLLTMTFIGVTWGWLRWHRPRARTEATGASPARATLAGTTSKTITLGIVPFEAESPEAVEIASSMRLDLTDVLSKKPGIRMRAAHSLESIKPDGTDLSHQMTALGLDEVLFGRLSLRGKRCHLELELVRASDGTHIGTLQYTGTEHELSTISDRIQHDLLARLQMPVQDVAASGDAVDPRAYQTYLKGRYQFSLQNEHSLPLALRFFSEAAQIDPKFAKAYTYLARTNIVAGIHGFIPRIASLKSASESLAMAEQLDPDGGEVHALRGMLLYLRDWDLLAAQNELRRAIAIDPNDPSYRQWLAITLTASGRNAEAQTEVDRARSMDPYWIPIFLTQTYVAHNAGDTARVIATARELKEMAPGSAYALDVMGNALWYGGQRAEAIAQWRSMAVQEHDTQRIELEDRGAAAFRAGGVAAYARVRLSAIHAGQLGLHPNDFEPTEWYATAGDDHAALAAMQHLYDERDPTFFDFALDPMLANVRKLPEFQALLHRIRGLQIPEP